MKSHDNQHEIGDCINNLQFVPTSNHREGYLQDVPEDIGNCAVVALSISTGICYGTTYRRLSAIVEALEYVTGDRKQNEQEVFDIDPTKGTPRLVCELFLQMHGFDKQEEWDCICTASETSCVVLGTTDTVDHVAAIMDRKVFGQYDVTTEEFNVNEVWIGSKRTTQKLEAINTKDFASRRKLIARLKRMLR